MRQFDPTPEQRAVIEHRGSHALVFAGPGTGKTETLARRFASLVVDDGIDPSAILVLTFSRRAAEGMLDRVLLRLRERTGAELGVSELFVKTFHSFCSRLLDGDGARFRKRDLLTPIKERLLWKGVAAQVPLQSFDADVRTSPAFAADALNLIAQLKGQGIGPADLARASGDNVRLNDVAALYRALDADRLRLGLSDFRDLVSDALAALTQPESPASRWLRERGPFRHILVDEFQDSDKLQLQLLERLAGDGRARPNPTPEICFVGDFNQSIYRFRGATPANIAAVREEFRCTPLTLRTNRRSTQAILDVANQTPQLDSESLTSAEDPLLAGSVWLERAFSPDAEVTRVCEFVEERIAAGTPPREIAVLLRVSEPYTSRIIAGLDARGIPVAARPAAGFLEDPAIGAVLTAMRLLGDVENETLWTRLLTNPIVGFRAVSVRIAFDAARRAGIHHPITILQAAPPAGVRAFDDFLASWRRVEREAADADAASLIASIAREFDLLGPVRTGGIPPGWDSRSSPARLGVLAEAAADLEATSQALGSGRVSPARFVADIEEIAGLLSDPADVPPIESEGVRVMSIHAAKGLEFDVVVVPQALDGVLPQRERGHALLPAASVRALRATWPTLFADDDEAFQEECSLWYVALTRARRDVLVTAAEADADDIELPLSRFARLIGPATRSASNGALASGPYKGAHAVGTRQPDEPILITPVQPRRPLAHVVDHLSPSTIETYLACPRRFFYGHVLALAAEIDEEVPLLGNIIHRVLADFHERERDFTSAVDLEAKSAGWRAALLELVDRVAEPVARRAGRSIDSNFMRYQLAIVRTYLMRYVDLLVREVASDPFTVLACELPLDTEIGGVRVRGRADRVDRLAAGGLVIRDYKSGASRPKTATAVRTALERVDSGEPLAGNAPKGLNLQTLLYIPGVEDMYGEPVVRVEYLYFRGKKNEGKQIEADTLEIVDDDAHVDSGRLTRAEVARVQFDLAASIARSMADGSISAFSTALDVETCRFCDFIHACPGALTVAP